MSLNWMRIGKSGKLMMMIRLVRWESLYSRDSETDEWR